MACDVHLAHVPAAQRLAAEAADPAALDGLRRALPLRRGGGEQRRVVVVLDVLAQVVGPQEGAVGERAGHALADAVVRREVLVCGVLGHAEGAVAVAALRERESWSGKHAAPLNPRQVLCLLVPSPRPGRQVLKAERALPGLLCGGWWGEGLAWEAG